MSLGSSKCYCPVYMKGVNTCSAWQGAITRSTPLQIQKSLWFPPLATPCLFILHPILASVLIAVRILSFSLNYRFLPKCHICGPGHSPAPIPNRTDSCTSASELGRAHLPLLCLRHKQRVYHLQVFTVLKTKVFKTCPCEFVSNQCNN